MKLVNLNTNAVLALIAAVFIAISVPAKAEESGFTLEDSIRNQIFMELKSNVRDMYDSEKLLVPGIDTSAASRVASSNLNAGNVLPVDLNSNEIEENNTVNNIN